MRTREEIENKIKELQDYLDYCEQRGIGSSKVEKQVEYLRIILNTNEDLNAIWEYHKEHTAPYFYYEDRIKAKNEQEKFYNQNLKGKNRVSKRYNELWEQYAALDVPEYDEYRWELYRVLGWLMDEIDIHGCKILM